MNPRTGNVARDIDTFVFIFIFIRKQQTADTTGKE